MHTYRQDEEGKWICCAYGERIVAHSFDHMERLVADARDRRDRRDRREKALEHRRQEQRAALLRKSRTPFFPRAS